MAIIVSGDLSDLYNQRTFRANGSTVTLKKISETDWLLFGDLAEGDSQGFPEAPLICESKTSWDGEGASFGIKAGESIWAGDSYGYGVDAFFAYDSQGVKEQTGEFATPIPEGIDWLLMGFNPDGGLVVVLKELDGTPVLSESSQLMIAVTDGFNTDVLTANWEENASIFYAESYEASIFPQIGDTMCVLATPQEADFEWQYEFEGYGETIQPVGFNDEVEDLDISVPLDTSGSIVFRPYGGGVAIPEPNTPWLRVRMAGVFTGLEYVITYGNESQESGVIVGGGFNFQTGDKGGFISLEIQRPSTSVPQIGWISFNWTAPF